MITLRKFRTVLTVLASVALLFLAVPSHAQTPAPAPAPAVQYFTISVNAAGYNGVKGMTPVTIAGAAVQLTPNLSVGYNQIFNPNDSSSAKFELGVANYTRELGSLCSYCKNHFLFDTTNFLITFQGGAGRVSYTLPGATSSSRHVAEDFGVFASIPMASHVSFQVLGYQVIHGAGTTTLTRNVTQQVSSGLYFTF